ncbi:WD40 repeat domain-containing protein, partial [Candidatus Poribacteria bacterium]|nr:WD40 repeat domain-containing protein [Candidatus Poribacteria bacterium]
MQKTVFLILAIGLAICVVPKNTIAQDTQDWRLQHLPEGAKARFGKGMITGNFASSSDGKRLAVTCSIGIWIYDTETDKPLNLITGYTGWVTNVAFSPDDTLLASASKDSTIGVRDARTGTELWTLQAHEDKITDIAFSPDGKTLASASSDETIRLWDARTGKHLRTLEGHLEGITSLAFNPDGKTLASGSHDKTVRLWDMETGKTLHAFIAHQDKG